MKRKFLSFILSLCMVLSLIPTNSLVAVASDIETEETVVEESAVPEETEVPEISEKTEEAPEEQNNNPAVPEEDMTEVTAEEAVVPAEAIPVLEFQTIESLPASDGAKAVISGNLPAGAKAVIKSVVLSETDLIMYFGAEKAAAMTGYVAYDIKILDVNGNEWQPDETVNVTVKKADIEPAQNEAVGTLHIDGESGMTSDLATEFDGNGNVSFETPSFSIFIIFTVDFEFEGYTYSMNGMEGILLSDLFAVLSIARNINDVVNVEFTNTELVSVIPQGNDWLLQSNAPFGSDEVLTVTFGNGEKIEINVTDAKTYYTGEYNVRGAGEFDFNCVSSTSSPTIIAVATIDGDVVWNIPSDINGVQAITLTSGSTLTINTDHDFSLAASGNPIITCEGNNKVIINGTGTAKITAPNKGLPNISNSEITVITPGDIEWGQATGTLTNVKFTLQSTAGNVTTNAVTLAGSSTLDIDAPEGNVTTANLIIKDNSMVDIDAKGTVAVGNATISGTSSCTITSESDCQISYISASNTAEVEVNAGGSFKVTNTTNGITAKNDAKITVDAAGDTSITTIKANSGSTDTGIASVSVEADGKVTVSGAITAGADSEINIKAGDDTATHSVTANGNSNIYLEFDGNLAPSSNVDRYTASGTATLTLKSVGTEDHFFVQQTTQNAQLVVNTATATLNVEGTKDSHLIFDGYASWDGDEDSVLGRGTESKYREFRKILDDDKGGTVNFNYVDIQNINNSTENAGYNLFRLGGDNGNYTFTHVTFKNIFDTAYSSSAPNESGIIQIQDGAHVTFDDLKVYGTEYRFGSAASVTKNGAGIIDIVANSSADVTIKNVEMYNNKLSVVEKRNYLQTDRMALVYTTSPNAKVSVENAKFHDNLFNFSGGAIAVTNAALTLKDVEIKGNVTELGSEGRGVTALAGCALSIGAVKQDQTVTFEGDCIIEENSAVRRGGAIAVWTGADTLDNHTLTLDLGDTIIRKNSAKEGGAFHSASKEGNPTTVIVNGGIFEKNSAEELGGAAVIGMNTSVTFNETIFTEHEALYGGALYNNGNLVLNNCTIEKSSADQDGGAVYTAVGSLIVNDGSMTENEAESGGAIFSVNGAVAVDNTIITDNRAIGVCDISTASSFSLRKGAGGGIYAAAGTVEIIEADKANIYGNTADFAGDDILTLKNVKLTLPSETDKKLALDDNKTAGEWREDYVKDDAAYASGLQKGTKGERLHSAIADGGATPAVDALDNSTVYTALSLDYDLPMAEYTIEYYFDNVQAEEKTFKSEGIIGTTISDHTDYSMKGKYRLDSEINFPFTISSEKENNIAKVYYVSDPDNAEVITTKRLTRTGMDDMLLTLSAYVKNEGVLVTSYKPVDIVFVVDASNSAHDIPRNAKVYTQQELIDIDRATGGLVRENAKTRNFYTAKSGAGTYYLQYEPEEALPWKFYNNYDKPGTERTPVNSYATLECADLNQYTFQISGLGVTVNALKKLQDNLVKIGQANGVDYRIAIIDYALYTYLVTPGMVPGSVENKITKTSDFTGALKSVSKDYAYVRETIESLSIPMEGNTISDTGFLCAPLIFEQNADGQDRELVVIHVGDEALTSGGTTTKDEAAAMKKNGASIFCIDTMKDPSSGGVFDLASSNYESVSKNNDTRVSSEYHLNGNSEEAMLSVFEKITEYVTKTEGIADENAMLVDTLSSDFKLSDSIKKDVNPDGTYIGDEIKVYVEEVTEFDENNQPVFGNRQELDSAKIVVNIQDNKVSVSGFDYSKYWVNKDHEPISDCRRIIVEIPIENSEANEGGISQVTNDDINSGIYLAEGEKLIDFDVPKTDTPTSMTIEKIRTNGQNDTFTFDVTYNKVTGYEQDSSNDHYIKALYESATDTVSIAVAEDQNTKVVSGTSKVTEIYDAPGTTIKIKETTPGYRISSVTYTSDETETPVSITEFADDGSFIVPVEANLIVTVTNELDITDLTITKQVVDKDGEAVEAFDEDDYFIFRVTGGPDDAPVDMMVSAANGESVVIKDLVIGEYSVTEVTDWSWRYTPDQDRYEITLEADPEKNVVTVKNTLKTDKWLGGSSNAVNNLLGKGEN